MKNIAIIVPLNAILANIEGPRQILAAVNDFYASQGKQTIFNLQLVGLNRETRLNNGLFSIHTDYTIHNTQKFDLIIIPAMNGEIKIAVELNKDFIPWIQKQYLQGAEVASLCVGAFLLASTGLLQGKKCATHWLAANDFRREFPDVTLVTDRIITDENGIYSSGGAYSSLNLILYLIEKYAGRDAALFCSKIFQLDIDRYSQSQFMMFTGQKGHEDDQIKKAQEYIEQNFRDKITVDQLASLLAIGRRNFERRFKKATSNTVVEYIQRVKIEAAKINLESSRENVNEVMYKVGYSDTKAFRTTFKKITGLSPIQYRSKYNREVSYE